MRMQKSRIWLYLLALAWLTLTVKKTGLKAVQQFVRSEIKYLLCLSCVCAYTRSRFLFYLYPQISGSGGTINSTTIAKYTSNSTKSETVV
jgi:hypothetical protein